MRKVCYVLAGKPYVQVAARTAVYATAQARVTSTGLRALLPPETLPPSSSSPAPNRVSLRYDHPSAKFTGSGASERA